MFVKIDPRAGAAIVIAALLVVWALVAPDAVSGTIDTVGSVFWGAVNGATGAA